MIYTIGNGLDSKRPSTVDPSRKKKCANCLRPIILPKVKSEKFFCPYCGKEIKQP